MAPGRSAACPVCGQSVEPDAGPTWAVPLSTASSAGRTWSAPAIIGMVAAVVAVMVVGVLLVSSGSRRGPITAASGAGGETSSTTAAPGSSTSTAAPVAATPATGPCGVIPELKAVGGPADRDALIKTITRGIVNVGALEATYGKLNRELATRTESIDELVSQSLMNDPAKRRLELEADGFRQAAMQAFTSRSGDQIALLAVQLGSDAQALTYSRAHLADVCQTSSAIEPSKLVPGAVTYYGQEPAGRQRVRFVAVVGDTEVNVTLCTCRPGDTAMAAGEQWAQSIVRQLAAAQA